MWRYSEIIDEIERRCGSLWEGCFCDRDKAHEGDHECIAEGCGDIWTEEQAITWWKEVAS